MTREKPDDEHYFDSQPKSKGNLGLIRSNLRDEALEFLTAPSVFSKTRIDLGSRLLAEAMALPKIGNVLDIGCGYGVVGITAASSNPRLRVVMTDVNMRAVQLARKNCRLNRVTNCEIRNGYLFEPVKELTFNCVLSNPPVSAGMETVKAIICDAPKVMAEKATLQMVVRSKIGAKTLPRILSETFGNCSVLARESGYRVLIAEKQ